jgi:stearoyl-CoA desaturase (delta-9 desaturase)
LGRILYEASLLFKSNIRKRFMIFENWSLLGGVLYFSILELIISTLGVTHVTLLSVTIYLHRYISHKAIELGLVARLFFRLVVWLTTGQDPKEWGSIHRKHHANVDAEGDPHSPVVFHIETPLQWIKWIFGGGVYYYVLAGRDKGSLEDYSHGIPLGDTDIESWLERKIYAPHPFFGVGVLLGIINVLLFGLPGLLIWGIQALCVPVLAAGVINGVGHRFGYRNYKHGKEYPNVAFSVNIVPLGVIIVGEELHNNHHADAGAPKFSHKWWEFDEGWMWIRALCLLRLAKLRKPLVAKSKFQAIYYKVVNLA